MVGGVSLYIPCYNAERHLHYCLEGVLGQTRPADEIIVVDDGSTDNTVEIARAYPVKIVKHQQNRGLGAARNTGVMESSHDLVASLDSDCVARPDWLEKLLDCLSAHDTAGCGGRLVERNCSRLPDRWRTHNMRQHWGYEPKVNPLFLFGNNTLYRKSVLLEAGLYDERLRTNFEDVSMSEKIAQRGHILVYEPKAVVEHLRTDTLSSVLRTNWKWRFLGHLYDTNIKDTLRGIRRDRISELRYFLSNDVRRKDIACVALSCAAMVYALVSDVKYLLGHYGEKRIHVSSTDEKNDYQS